MYSASCIHYTGAKPNRVFPLVWISCCVFYAWDSLQTALVFETSPKTSDFCEKYKTEIKLVLLKVTSKLCYCLSYCEMWVSLPSYGDVGAQSNVCVGRWGGGGVTRSQKQIISTTGNTLRKPQQWLYWRPAWSQLVLGFILQPAEMHEIWTKSSIKQHAKEMTYIHNLVSIRFI